MTKFAWHVHHTVLMEPLTDTLRRRAVYIEAIKPPWQIKLRLRLMRKVRGKLPPEVIEAGRAYVKAWNSKEPLKPQLYEAARVANNKAVAAHMPYIETLHRLECPSCPWNGHTIFPHGEADE